ncbi:MAG: DNA translocase FtsK [Prevotella sp.]|nr:DNA translocase FtsK [Prevotella sp.]
MAKKKKTSTKNSFNAVTGFDLFQNEKLNFVIGVVLLGLGIFTTVAFVSFINTGDIDLTMIESPRQGEIMNENGEFVNSCGSLGAYMSYFFMKKCFGLAAFAIPFFLMLTSLKMMRVYNIVLTKWFLGTSLVMVWASITMAKFLAPLFIDSCYNPGGDHGRYVCQWTENLVGAPGLTALLLILAVGFLTYLSAETIYVIRKMLNPTLFFNKVKFEVSGGKREDDTPMDVITTEPDPKVFDDPESQTVEFTIDDNEEQDGNEEQQSIELAVDTDNNSKADTKQTDAKPKGDIELDVEVSKAEAKADGKSLVSVGDKMLEAYDPKLDLENYRYPTLDLLKHYESDGNPFIDMKEQNDNKNRIVDVLRNFSVEISSIKATVGPTITLYEITPAQGVRISKIRNLEDDIALSLSALGIRIIAPIPGKGTIGIEVPNANPNIVSMESILNSKKFQETQMELPCAVGKTITNEVFMFDLAKIPHLLVAGATGQGKSVGLNAIITSLLYKKHPAELKIVLIDPKKVEFSIYTPLEKHFLAMVPDEGAEPIITDVTKVVRTLNSLCKEMDTRYDLLKIAGARNIKEYNKKFKDRQLNPQNGHRFMPYIVVVIDEFGDLIMTAGKEIELPIARIAQLARAVGIHMVIATQRPTTSIITGNIKANFPGRIAFKVSAMIDSKTILDRPGANQLIGRGDMLFLNGNEPVRVQCAFVDTPEVERINQFIAQQQGYVTTFELPEPDTGDGDLGGASDVDMQHLDPLFEDAARVIIMSQSGSTSLIQRKFSIGYNRAGRIMDQMEKAGIVGAASGSKPREVLIQDEVSLENLLSNFR